MLNSRGTLPAQSFFGLLDWCPRERLCLNRIWSLLSMPCMLLGYISEPRPNSRALGSTGSVMTIDRFINKRMLALVKPVWKNRLKEQDWLVKTFGLRRPQKAWRDLGKGPFSLFFPSSKKTEGHSARGVFKGLLWNYMTKAKQMVRSLSLSRKWSL